MSKRPTNKRDAQMLEMLRSSSILNADARLSDLIEATQNIDQMGDVYGYTVVYDSDKYAFVVK